MTEVKFDTTKQDCCFPVEEYVTKDVVDEKIKNIDSKLQKKIKASTKDLKKEVNKVENSMKKVQDNFNKQIEEHNQKLECYIQKEKDVEYLKTVCKKVLKIDYIEMVSNRLVEQELGKMVMKLLIKELKSRLKKYKELDFNEIVPYINAFHYPDKQIIPNQIIESMERIKNYNKKYGG